MALTGIQLKNKIKKLAKNSGVDARLLIRYYVMNRFLDRLSLSKYYNNFIIKGGVLVTALIGIHYRSTLDIDFSATNINIQQENLISIINTICNIEIDDNVKFIFTDIKKIMDNMEYTGYRISLIGMIDNIKVPIKIDISTGDIITPGAIKFNYELLLEERSINLWSYNIETVLSEKLQTIITRSIYNTRMRDFYDVYTLYNIYSSKINYYLLKTALMNTCSNRETFITYESVFKTIESINSSLELKKLWISYQMKYDYAKNITYDMVIDCLNKLIKIIYDN